MKLRHPVAKEIRM